MIQKFYKLSRNIDRFQPFGVGEFGDGYLETKFNNWEEIESAFPAAIKIDLIGDDGIVLRKKQSDNLLHVVKVQMPAELVFIGFDDLFEYTDYPYLQNIRLWPVISIKMLDVLLSLSSFSYQAVPVIFEKVDSLLLTSEEKIKAPPFLNHEFIILQLLEYLNAFDRDKSVYTIEYDENLAGEPVEFINIDKLVLKEPLNGFPSIFRVKEDKTSLYVSAEAKEALEKTGIKGLDFE